MGKDAKIRRIETVKQIKLYKHYERFINYCIRRYGLSNSPARVQGQHRTGRNFRLRLESRKERDADGAASL